MTIAIAQGISPALNHFYSKPQHNKFAMPWIWLYLGSDTA